MKTKPIKLSPKKGGNGYVSSYSINIGCSEARTAGFLDADENPLPIKKIIDAENHQIIICLETGE